MQKIIQLSEGELETGAASGDAAALDLSAAKLILPKAASDRSLQLPDLDVALPTTDEVARFAPSAESGDVSPADRQDLIHASVEPAQALANILERREPKNEFLDRVILSLRAMNGADDLIPLRVGLVSSEAVSRQDEILRYYDKNHGIVEDVISRPGLVERAAITLVRLPIDQPELQTTEAAGLSIASAALLLNECRLATNHDLPGMPGLAEETLRILESGLYIRSLREEYYKVLSATTLTERQLERVLTVQIDQLDLGHSSALQFATGLVALNPASTPITTIESERDALMEKLRAPAQVLLDQFSELEREVRGLIIGDSLTSPVNGKIGLEVEFGGMYARRAVDDGWRIGVDGLNFEARREISALEYGTGYIQSVTDLSRFLQESASGTSSVHIHLDEKRHPHKPDIGFLLGNAYGVGVYPNSLGTWEVRGLFPPLDGNSFHSGTVCDLIALHVKASEPPGERQPLLKLRDPPYYPSQIIWGHICASIPDPEGRLAALSALRHPRVFASHDVMAIAQSYAREDWPALTEILKPPHESEALFLGQNHETFCRAASGDIGAYFSAFFEHRTRGWPLVEGIARNEEWAAAGAEALFESCPSDDVQLFSESLHQVFSQAPLLAQRVEDLCLRKLCEGSDPEEQEKALGLLYPIPGAAARHEDLLTDLAGGDDDIADTARMLLIDHHDELNPNSARLLALLDSRSTDSSRVTIIACMGCHQEVVSQCSGRLKELSLDPDQAPEVSQAALTALASHRALYDEERDYFDVVMRLDDEVLGPVLCRKLAEFPDIAVRYMDEILAATGECGRQTATAISYLAAVGEQVMLSSSGKLVDFLADDRIPLDKRTKLLEIFAAVPNTAVKTGVLREACAQPELTSLAAGILLFVEPVTLERCEAEISRLLETGDNEILRLVLAAMRKIEPGSISPHADALEDILHGPYPDGHRNSALRLLSTVRNMEDFLVQTLAPLSHELQDQALDCAGEIEGFFERHPRLLTKALASAVSRDKALEILFGEPRLISQFSVEVIEALGDDDHSIQILAASVLASTPESFAAHADRLLPLIGNDDPGLSEALFQRLLEHPEITAQQIDTLKHLAPESPAARAVLACFPNLLGNLDRDRPINLSDDKVNLIRYRMNGHRSLPAR